MKYPYAFVLLFSALTLLGMADSPGTQRARLKQATADRLRDKIAKRLTDTAIPPLETFIVEDNLGQEIPVSSVPEKIQIEAEQWMRQLMRPEWLPQDIRSSMKARKDVVVQEGPAPEGGKTVSRDVGDFMVLDYEIHGHQILLLESGKALTARIKLPEETDVTKVTARDMLKITSAFFTVPETAIHPKDIKIEGDDLLRSFSWVNGPTPEETTKRYYMGEHIDWWVVRLRLYFDGQTLLISMPEIPYPPRFNTHLMLPDRF